MQDRTYVPLRAGRHLRVHGVVTGKKKGERETEQVLREEEHRKTCETSQARGWFSTDPSSTEQDGYRATNEMCQMPVPSNDDRSINSVFSHIAARCVALHMRTWRLRTNPKNTWKTATTQIMLRRWRKTTTHGTRHLRRSRCLAPAQWYSRACKDGRYAGWLYRAPSLWTFCTCPWSGKQGSERRVKRAKHADGSPRTPRARSRTIIEPRGKGANRQDDGGPYTETPVEQVWEAV